MEEKKIEERRDVSGETQETAEKPRYNKTWQALLDHPVKMVVYDKTLFYR